jgi:hypothetical protein
VTLSTDRDKVRLLIGDTDETDPLLYDDEVDALLAQRVHVVTTGGTIYNLPAAAADACGAIAAKFARDFDFAEDGQNFSREAGRFVHADDAWRYRLHNLGPRAAKCDRG